MGETVVGFCVQPQQAGLRLGVFLRRQGLSLGVVRGLKQQPLGITRNGRPARTNELVQADDEVRLRLPAPEGFSARPQRLGLDIVYESADALVLNKPPGMPVHPGPGIYGGTLANAVCGLYAARGEPGGAFRPVGRLDAGTSGLVLCARHAAAAAKLAASCEKVYLALACGRMPGGTGMVDAPLGPKPGSAVRQQADPAGRPCLTEYEVLAVGDGVSLARVHLRTGRTHQIRAHFSHLGYPLLGDGLYGGDVGGLKRQALHCAGLCFEELGQNRPRLSCVPPADMLGAAAAAGLLEALRGAAQTLF